MLQRAVPRHEHFLQVANHAALILPESTTSHRQAQLGKGNLTSDWLIQTILASDWLIDICEAVVSKFSELKDRNFLNLSNPKYSGKMEVLTTLLNVIEDEGGKVLLFSHSTQLLNIIETFAQSKGYCYCRLDGNI